MRSLREAFSHLPLRFYGLAFIGAMLLAGIFWSPQQAVYGQSNLLTNGGFEQGPAELALTSVPGWIVERGTVDVAINQPNNGHWLQAAEGSKSLELIGTPGVARIRQTFNTVAGQRYSFTGWVSHHYGVGEASVNVFINNALAGTLFHNTPNTQGDMKWQRFQLQFTATSAQTTLALEDRNLAGWDFGGAVVDGLAVQPVGASNTATVVNRVVTDQLRSTTSCDAPANKSVFATTDARAYQWTLLDGIKSSDVIRWEFIQPNGATYYDVNFPLNLNGGGCAWAGINIAGFPASGLAGGWQVRVSLNGAVLFTDNFTIGTAAPPTQTGAAIIIDGTDANEHGSVSSGINRDGWLYMQKALENLATQVTPGTAKVVVDLGTAPNTKARQAIDSALSLSTLRNAGWTITHVDGADSINNWLANLSTANTGILYLPTYNLTSGDLTADEMAAINAQAARIASFTNRNTGAPGGALFAMGEINETSRPGAWGWLRALFPALSFAEFTDSGINKSISLTTDGIAAFPGLTNADIGDAKPWHNYFGGDLGVLKPLGVAPDRDNVTRPVIIGGVGIVIPPPPPPTPTPTPTPVPTPTPGGGNRVVRVACVNASAGSTVAVPIELVAQGDENALGFSLSFNTALLSNPQIAKGSDAAAALLNTNMSQAGQGRGGLAVSLPSGQTFTRGTRQVAVLTFNVATNPSASSTAIEFNDSPIRRQLSDANAQSLSGDYQGCANLAIVTQRGYEADVTPRPNGKGDGSISITDWVLVGRFAAGLDNASNGSEFQRADCAPRDSKGDGSISITDWVQAGRYAAGLDAAQTAGGPTSFTELSANALLYRTAHAREIRAVNTTVTRGQAGNVAIEIEAEGDENALGFSVNFDPAVLSYVSTTADISGALLNLNTSQSANGRVGIALALPAGQTLPAGKRTVVTARFNSNANSTAATTPILFGDQPIRRQLADANANSLLANFNDGVISFGGGSGGANPLANVSAASYRAECAADSIAAGFGVSLATQVQTAATLPLPTSLAGTTVSVRDSASVERLAPLFFVAPSQVNYLVPAETANGQATVTITSGSGVRSVGTLNVQTTAPSLFAANGDGQGVAAAVLLRVSSNGALNYESVARWDAAINRFVPLTLNVGAADEQLFLILFGTGTRSHSGLSTVTATVADQNANVLYLGPAGSFAGLDQANVSLPRNLAGRGVLNVTLSVAGRASNTIQIAF